MTTMRPSDFARVERRRRALAKAVERRIAKFAIDDPSLILGARMALEFGYADTYCDRLDMLDDLIGDVPNKDDLVEIIAADAVEHAKADIDWANEEFADRMYGEGRWHDVAARLGVIR